jgi:hypothetical protein
MIVVLQYIVVVYAVVLYSVLQKRTNQKLSTRSKKSSVASMGPKLEILSHMEVMHQCDSTLRNATREFNIQGIISFGNGG